MCRLVVSHPSRQSEQSPLSSHVRKVQTFPLYTGLLARAVYPPPSPSRRSGASPAVVMTLCEKEKKRTADPNERTDCPACLEDGEARKSSMDITDKTAIPGGGKSKRQWMTCPGMYKVSVAARTSVWPCSCPYWILWVTCCMFTLITDWLGVHLYAFVRECFTVIFATLFDGDNAIREGKPLS